MSTKSTRKEEKTRLKELEEKKLARKKLLKQFLPLVFAVGAWVVLMGIIHLHVFREEVFNFFVAFTVKSVVFLGWLTFLPIENLGNPNISVAGYPMTVIMECTAYNFYIFVICLSLFSPVSWRQRLYTLSIFIPAVFLLNSLRFITMGYIGRYYPQQFDNIHDYLWNILFGFLIFLIWVLRYQHVMINSIQQREETEVKH